MEVGVATRERGGSDGGPPAPPPPPVGPVHVLLSPLPKNLVVVVEAEEGVFLREWAGDGSDSPADEELFLTPSPRSGVEPGPGFGDPTLVVVGDGGGGRVCQGHHQ